MEKLVERHRAGLARYVVPSNFDRTPISGKLSKLEDHLVSRAIIGIIQSTYKNTGPNWAKQNPLVAKHFFHGPTYPMYAKVNLGYEDETSDSNYVTEGFR